MTVPELSIIHIKDPYYENLVLEVRVGDGVDSGATLTTTGFGYLVRARPHLFRKGRFSPHTTLEAVAKVNTKNADRTVITQANLDNSDQFRIPDNLPTVELAQLRLTRRGREKQKRLMETQ